MIDPEIFKLFIFTESGRPIIIFGQLFVTSISPEVPQIPNNPVHPFKDLTAPFSVTLPSVATLKSEES